tara:strand:- start:47732 stop:48151 length:420 start_codon:yes stop_codon:yes gene_type:complete
LKTIDILRKINNNEELFNFLYYDGVSYLYMLKYENRYFFYSWIKEDVDEVKNEKFEIFGIVELSFQDLNDISNKKHPLLYYYKNKKNYIEKRYLNNNGIPNTEIYEQSLDDEDWIEKNYYLEEIEDLSRYVLSKKVNKF